MGGEWEQRGAVLHSLYRAAVTKRELSPEAPLNLGSYPHLMVMKDGSRPKELGRGYKRPEMGFLGRVAGVSLREAQPFVRSLE